jgi:uncharacterized protein (DUF305 family)
MGQRFGRVGEPLPSRYGVGARWVRTWVRNRISGVEKSLISLHAMQKMQNDMPKKGTGDADKDFVTMMLPHHQGAVDMAKVELQYGKDPKLKKMAARIVKDPEKEFREMKAWLSKRQ